jgi:hypothetical protein
MSVPNPDYCVDYALEGKYWILALVWTNLLTIKLVLIMSVPQT